MIVDKALQLKLKHENLHLMGLTPLHPFETKLEGSKFFAFKRILKDVEVQNGFKWLYIPNHFGHADFVGVKLTEFINGSYSANFKWAKTI